MTRYLITYEKGAETMIIEAPSKRIASDKFHDQFGEGDEWRDTEIVRIDQLTTVWEPPVEKTFVRGS